MASNTPLISTDQPSSTDPAVLAQDAQAHEHDQFIPHDDLETDSAYAEENASYTTSLRSSVQDYRYEFGRRYHAFREGRHFLPNDEQEQQRMDIHHILCLARLDGLLYKAPVKEPQRVLDLGTGTGQWAIDFADTHESSHVIGNDLSPIQPTYVPPNVEFVVDDIEDEWNYEHNPFDFIHARYLAGSIRDWPRLMSQAFACTKPGGWVEFQDWDCFVECHDGSVPHDSAFYKWHEYVLNRIENVATGRPGRYLEKWVKEAGFVNVIVEKLPIPSGTWPKDRNLVCRALSLV